MNEIRFGDAVESDTIAELLQPTKDWFVTLHLFNPEPDGPTIEGEVAYVDRNGVALKPGNGECAYEFDGHDTDGTEWHRCTTHDELAPSPDAPCAGYQEIPYKAGNDLWHWVNIEAITIH